MTKHKPPRTIYLQNWDAPGYEDTTWCIDKINGETDECEDAEYMHVDIVNELLEALEEVTHQLYNYIAENYGSYVAESDVFIRQARQAIARQRANEADVLLGQEK